MLSISLNFPVHNVLFAKINQIEPGSIGHDFDEYSSGIVASRTSDLCFATLVTCLTWRMLLATDEPPETSNSTNPCEPFRLVNVDPPQKGGAKLFHLFSACAQPFSAFGRRRGSFSCVDAVLPGAICLQRSGPGDGSRRGDAAWLGRETCLCVALSLKCWMFFCGSHIFNWCSLYIILLAFAFHLFA